MRARFSIPVAAMVMTLAVVIGTAVMGFFTAAVVDTQYQSLRMAPAAAVSTFLKPILAVVVLGALAGVLGWMVLFALRRDGFHRMECVALLPFNYGGRNPFDTSPR